MADEPTDEDVIAMAQHPLVAVWCAGGDVASSEDFRDANDDLDEAAYVRYALNVMRRVHAEVRAKVAAEIEQAILTAHRPDPVFDTYGIVIAARVCREYAARIAEGGDTDGR